jgi:hypothetical protein
VELIRSPSFNRLAARTHSRVQKIKLQWGGTEEEIKQLKEQEKLLKDAEEKFKSLDSEPTRNIPIHIEFSWVGSETNELSRFWQVFKDEFRNRNK